MLATNYLLRKGHKSIATIGYKSELAHYKDRYEGYFEALNKADIVLNQKLVYRIDHLFLKRDMKTVINKIVNDGTVKAIYFQTNTLAEEGLRQLIGFGREILQEIDVVVFDQNSAYYFLENFVPYIEQPIKKMVKKH